MKLELDSNSSQNTTLINHSENDLAGSEDVKKMLRSGISLAKEGNRIEARQMLLSVTEVEQNNETAWLWLASISEYPEELLVFLQNVLKVNPNNERALEWAKQTKSLLSKTFVQRGINAAQNNQKEFAKQCFLQGIVHDSENEMAWLWLASTSESQEEKVSHLHQVLRINPDNETALSSLSAVKGQMSQGLLKKASSAAIAGDHETARQTLNTIMKNSPNIEEAWILKAFLTTDFYEKIECYEKALEINPECEAAQAGLDSLKLLMPKIAKPAVEAAKPEEAVEEVKDELIEELAAAQETVSVEVEEVLVVEETVASQGAGAEYDEDFDLEKLAEELPVEALEFADEEFEQPESRAFAEEILLERQQEEEAIHETQTVFKEEFSATPSQQVRVESIFNYDEVISQEEAFAEERQANSAREFAEQSDNPTQELDEEFAQNAAASFGISVEENEEASELQVEAKIEEAVEPALEIEPEAKFEEAAETENNAELEDFYTEQAVESNEVSQDATAVESNEVSQDVAVDETKSVHPKAEVRVTEVYDTEVTTAEIYNSEFFANDGFVLVPQNDPFADHTQETVEFSYSEAEGVQEVSETEEVAQFGEIAQVEQVAEAQQTEEVEQIAEPQEVAEVEQVAELQEVAEVEQNAEEQEEIVEQVAQTEQFEEESQVVEPQEVVQVEYQETEQSEEVELVKAEQFEEVESVEAEESEEVVEAVSEEQSTEVEYHEEVVENQTMEQAEEVVENQVAESVEEVVETQFVEQAEEIVENQVVENQVVEQDDDFDECLATRVFDKYNQEILRAARGEVIEAAAESPRLEKTEQTVEVEQVAEPEQIEEIAQAEQFEETVEIEEVEEYVAVAEVKPQMPEEPQNQSTLCPFCAAENENEVEVCKSCQAMLSLADLEVLISHKGVNQDLLLQAIERMEVEKSLREFDSEELSYLAIAHLNAKNLEKGFNYLQEAAKLNPDNAILPSKIKFLKAHLEELTANKKSEGSIGRNRTILVVDDSPTVRKLISGKLEKCGHSVLSAIDGMDALAKINEVIPDLILLDITMPRLDGYQVCKLIRNNEMTKDVPIVMISGKDGFFDKVRGRMAGSSGYITKPFGPDTLMKTIETYLG